VRTVAAADSQVFDFSPDGRMLAMWDNGIALRDTATLGLIRTIDPRSSIVNGAFFTPDGKSIITDDERSVLKRWNVATAELEGTLFTQSTMEGAMGDNVARIAYSPDGKRFVSVTNNGKLAVRDAATKDVIFPLDGRLNSMRAMCSPDGREIVAGGYQTQELWFWDATTGKRMAHSTTPKWVNVNAGRYAVGKLGGVMVRAEVDEAKVRLREEDSGKEIATLIPLNDTEWAVTTPEGRFDTNKPLDAVTGLAWIVSNDPMTPRPLELFLRQYYEPGLLRRLLSCPVLGNCATEFPKLPSIAGLKRARPSTAFRGAK
jgi:WD40 repeat protein